MEEKDLKEIVTSNLINYRKANNYTQANLAEKINYSDKAVSKWERGESLPDLYTLMLLTELYGITLNDLVTNEETTKIKPKKKKNNHLTITLLSCLLVWLVATIAYVIPLIFTNIPHLWLTFIWALPVSFILLLVFSSLWGNNKTNFICVTGLILTIILSTCIPLYVCLSLSKVWFLFILFIPLELLNIFWFLLRK